MKSPIARDLEDLTRSPIQRVAKRLASRRRQLESLDLRPLRRRMSALRSRSGASSSLIQDAQERLHAFEELLADHLERERSCDFAEAPGGQAEPTDRLDQRVPVRRMRREHELLDEAMSDLLRATAALAEGLPNSLDRQLLDGLEQLAETLQAQILAENRALFPRLSSHGQSARHASL